MSEVITRSIERGTRMFLIYADQNDGMMLYANILDADGEIRNRVQLFSCGTRAEMVSRMEEMRDNLYDMIYDVQYSGSFRFIDDKPAEEETEEPSEAEEETEEENDG